MPQPRHEDGTAFCWKAWIVVSHGFLALSGFFLLMTVAGFALRLRTESLLIPFVPPFWPLHVVTGPFVILFLLAFLLVRALGCVARLMFPT